MKLIQAFAIMTVLLLPAFGYGNDLRVVSAEAAAKHLQKKIDPVYPNEPNVRIRGDVVLQVEISVSGTVTAIKAVSGHPILIAPAMDAVRKWRYSPFLLNGKPTAVQTTITVPLWAPYTREEAIAENERSQQFFKSIALCRKQMDGGELALAETTCKEAIIISAELPESRKMERVDAFQQMGHVFFMQRKFAESLENYQKELAIGETFLTSTNGELAAAHYHVGNGLWGTGRMDEADLQYKKAESGYKQASAHIDSAFLKNQYAKKLKLVLSDHSAMLRQMGRSADADALDKQGTTIAVIEGMHDQ